MVTRPGVAGRPGNQLLPGEERRRSQRVVIRVAVTLHFAGNPPPKALASHTLVINDHGAMLLCSRSFDTETRFELENQRTRQRASCRVTRTPRQTPEGFLVPVEFAKPMPGFWNISFPPTDWRPLND